MGLDKNNNNDSNTVDLTKLSDLERKAMPAYAPTDDDLYVLENGSVVLIKREDYGKIPWKMQGEWRWWSIDGIPADRFRPEWRIIGRYIPPIVDKLTKDNSELILKIGRLQTELNHLNSQPVAESQTETKNGFKEGDWVCPTQDTTYFDKDGGYFCSPVKKSTAGYLYFLDAEGSQRTNFAFWNVRHATFKEMATVKSSNK